MRAALCILALLLLAVPGGAHFHEGFFVEQHTLAFREASGTVLVEELFDLRNAGSEPFGGKVYLWLPPAAQVLRFGPEGRAGPPSPSGNGTSAALVAHDLAASGATIPPNGTVRFEAAWQAPVAAGQAVERRVVYDTGRLEVEVAAPLLLAARPASGQATFADVIRVALPPPPPLLEGWQALLLITATLLGGAWLWDRRRGRGRQKA